MKKTYEAPEFLFETFLVNDSLMSSDPTSWIWDPETGDIGTGGGHEGGDGGF